MDGDEKNEDNDYNNPQDKQRLFVSSTGLAIGHLAFYRKSPSGDNEQDDNGNFDG